MRSMNRKEPTTPKIRIERIFIDGNRLCVKPIEGQYDKIYRAGMSVSWDDQLRCFYYNGRETSNEVKINVIIQAVSNEYGVDLQIDQFTISELQE